MSKTHVAVGLVLIAVLCWSGNWVVGRSIRADVPPLGLNFWRWTTASMLLTPFALSRFLREMPAIKKNWRVLFGLGLLGAAMFQTMVYIGLHSTPAINALLLNATGPVFTLVIARIVLGDRVNARQMLGVAVSFAGAAWLVLRGDIEVLRTLDFTVGDIWIVVAMLVWGLYSVLLRFRSPEVGDLTVVYVIALVGAAVMFPAWLWELSQGTVIQPNKPTLLAVGYVGIIASILAFLSFNASVARIGPTKAVTFLYFMPVFGSIMAIVFLGEKLAGYHLAGFVVVMVGVILATVKGRARQKVQA